MKSIYKSIALLLILTSLSISVSASHYIGGTITWKCLSNGKYVFYLKLYRECAGVAFGNTATINSNSPASGIQVSLVSGYPKDISPICNADTSFTHLSCGSALSPNTGASSIYLYQSQPISINGVPPIAGWKFYYSSCCRNPSSNYAGSVSWYVLSMMYPYGNQNAYPCYDNSPDFASPSKTVLSTGFNSLAHFGADDEDIDNLSFEWAHLFLSTGQPITTYNAGYAYNSPFPGNLQNTNNVAAIIDSLTGLVTLTSFTAGAFATAVKVSSYRNNIKIAEVYKDMNLVIFNGDTNTPPNYSLISAPAVQIYTDTVFVGDTVNLYLGITDIQLLPNSTPQNVSLLYNSLQFGAFVPASGSNPATLNPNSGCLNPPCATLTPIGDTTNPLSGAMNVGTTFNWATSITNLAGKAQHLFNFYFHAKDDYCPVPAQKSMVVSILLTTGNIAQAPEVHCTQTMQSGDVVLNYNTVTDLNNSFQSYYVYSSASQNGPFTLLDSIANINVGQYTHIGAGANSIQTYYIVGVKSISAISNLTRFEYSDTISNIKLSIQKPNFCFNYLAWNAPHDTSSLSSSRWYRVYRKINSGNWSIIDSVKTLSYMDIANQNGDTNYYQVSNRSFNLKDSSGASISCFSESNIVNMIQSKSNLKSSAIRCIDVLSNGNVKLSWNKNTLKDFQCWKIFSSNSINGPYTPVATICDSNITNYTHIGAGADFQRKYYYLNELVRNCQYNSDTIPSTDTVSTLFTNLYTTSTNIIKLSWNPIRSTPLATAYNYYYIYERIFPGNWSLIDSTTNLHYSKTISFNNSMYKVSMKDINSFQSPWVCEGYSNNTPMSYLNAKGNSELSFEVSQNIPNPFDKTTIIKITSPINQEITFLLYDVNGKVVKSKALDAVMGENQISVSAKGLSSGVYFYELTDGAESIVKRLLVK